MATPSNKQIKIGTDVNFNHNDLINANIDASKNEITNGSNIKLSTGNTTLMDIFNDKQDKLVAGKNIIINSDGDFWTDFGNEHENNLKLLNSIPSFSSIKIIFKALCSNTSFDDNALFCRVDAEKYIGVRINSKPGIWNDGWSEGQTDIEENKKYWYCLFSDDAQTFTYYTIEDNNYRLDNLPELSEWTEQCSIEDNFFADQEFYIGYNPFSYNEYWKGNIYELQIKLDDAEWFNLKTAEEDVDYENNGCTYVGKIDNPIISAPNITYESGDNIKVDDTNSINFIGHNYTVKFIPGGLEGDTVLFEDTIITDSTLIFKNGQLLRNGEQYDYFSKIPAYVVNSIDDLEENDNLPPTTFVIFSQPLQDDDKIILINGLSVKQFTGITGTTLDTGSNVNSNIIVLKNGILLCGENSWSNRDGNNIITFGTPLNENDLITIIPNYNIRLMYTNVSPSDLEDGDTLLIPRHMSNATLVWVNTLLLTLSEDYDIVDGNKIKFYNNIITDNSFVQVSLDNADSIYNAIGDKQDRLPDYEPGKVLGTDGNSLIWVNAGGDTDDGVFHPRNGDELNEIFANEPGYSKTIDFSNFDFSTFYPDGYTINEKAFTIRNFSMGSNWGAWQFNWMKSPLFTLNNGATLYFQNLVINVEDVHHDPQGGSEASNTAPILRASNGSHISITNGGMININNVTGIDKYVAIELNDSNIYIQNFGITINSYDENRPDDIDSLTCAIECNGFSYAENNFDRAGFDISGNTTEKYGIKYNDDLGGFIKIGGGGFNVDGGNGYSIYCSNKTILELNFVNVGKIDGMPITVKQLSPNTDYYKDDIIEINDKLYQVTQDFNSNDYDNIEDGYGQVYEDFWTINVTGTMYSIEDPNERIGSYETTDGGYRASGLTLDTDNWNLPISDVHLQSDNAQDAIKELAARGGGGGSISQTDYWQHAEVIQDTITGITGDIIINESTYFSQVTGDRWVSYFKYDGSDWYLGDPDEGETPTLVDLSDYGIDVSQATFSTDSSFEVYSEYLNGKTSFTASQLVDIHSVFLNGNLQLKKDYVVNGHTITFNDYTLKASDSISII